MKSLALLVLTLYTFLGVVASISFGEQTISNELETTDIPDNLKLCGDNKDLLVVKDITIEPNPPKKGEEMHVDFKGFLKEEVGDGAKIDVVVKYGAVRLLHRVFDLCEQAPQVDKECPIEQGDFTANKTVALPKDIPPGKYTVMAHIYTEDERPITCITGTIVFRL
ncbi:ml domain-containing protein [Umbelopsis sp. PMI_123]|nr:ml domain-containing protein [Umbelopsis sp. PMI_123]